MRGRTWGGRGSGDGLSAGPSGGLMARVLERGVLSANRGEGVGSYLPPAQLRSSILQVLGDRNRARRNSRSAAAIFCASGVNCGIRPSGGSIIRDVRTPACFLDMKRSL